MYIKNLINFKKNSIISLVGAGGKTSFMFALAEEVRNELKVLVTTTTKIYIPKRNQYDFLCLDKNLFSHFNNKKDKGIYVYGDGINKQGKIIGLDNKYLMNVNKFFDIIIIESDGSKKKPIKGFREDEPLVYNKTDKTVGILDISVIGKKIDENNVHRIEEFIKITNSRLGEDINIDYLISLITHPHGLFKNALGEKILFINKVENEKYNMLARKLINKLVLIDIVDKVIIGSIKFKDYHIVFKKNKLI